ncbi:MAG TPA: ABC transporter ATP-binding protein [bacterium]|nr:ABC transporter ATP-binding protein [bacterium]
MAADPREAPAPLLSVHDLKVHFFLGDGIVKAVDGVSFDVFPGEIFGIVGETGCGKSVAMRALLRIVEPPGRIVSGRILWRRSPTKQGGPGENGVVDLAALPAGGPTMRAIRGAEIALIPQEPMAAFSPVHSVGGQIMEAIELHRGIHGRDARRLAAEICRQVGMPAPEQRLDDYAWQLSGGLRQRALIAMAVSCDPRLLVADEPTTAVDVTTQAQILRLLRRLQRERGAAVVFITHDLGVIAQMADRVMVMYLGRVMEQGPVDAIFHDAKHPYTQALLRSIPRLNSTTREHLPTISGSIPHPLNQPRGCPFHPRCPHAIPGTCDVRRPALRPVVRPASGGVGEGHLAACFLYSDAEEPVAEEGAPA